MASRLGSAGTGALSGAASGAAIGSFFPGIGTAIGTGVGGLIGLLGGYFGANDDEKGKFVSTLNPQQQQALGSVLQQMQQMQAPGGNYNQAQGYLSSMLQGSPQAYEQFAAPYRTEFEQQTLPGIAERFAGIGGGLGGGALGSSGFGQALGGAATQFQSNLSNLFANLRQQAAQQAFSQYGNLLSAGLGQYQAYQPGVPGFGATALSGLAQGAGSAFGQYAGNRLAQNLGAYPQQQQNTDLSGGFGPIY